MNPRITIFAGPVGAGKTEISINYALSLKQDDRPVALIDYDVVKPYIRVRDSVDVLRDSGLEVLMPEGKIAFADMPVVPQKIYHWIADKSRHLVIDVGGDKQGSTALGQIIPRLEPDDYEFNLVINPYRPFTSTVDGMRNLAEEVAQGAKARFTSMVGNPHVKDLTSIDDFKSGLEKIREGSKALGLPLKFISCSQEMYQEVLALNLPEKVLPLQLFVKYPWEDRRDKVSWIYKG